MHKLKLTGSSTNCSYWIAINYLKWLPIISYLFQIEPKNHHLPGPKNGQSTWFFFGKNRALGLVAVALSFHATIRSMSTRTSRHFGGLAHSSSVHFLNFTLGKQWKTPWYIMTCPHALLSVIKHGWSVVTTCGKRAGGNQHIYRHKSRHVGSKTTVFGC